MKTQTIYSIKVIGDSITREFTDADQYTLECNRLRDKDIEFNTCIYHENVSELQIDKNHTYLVDSASDLSLMGLTNTTAFNLRLVVKGGDAVETTIEVIVVDNKIVSEKWRVRTQDTDTAELNEPFTYKAKGKFRTALNELVLD